MKKLAIVFALGVYVLFCNTCFAVTTVVVDIEAMIDGRDWLIITGNTLQWHHFDFAAVGRHWGNNAPTIISTTINGVEQMDQENWIPEWPQDPPSEIRYPSFSSVFTNLFPGVPPTDIVIENVTLIPLVNRGFTTLKQFTDESVTIEFNDDGPSSHYWYEAQISFKLVPEPATMLLFGLVGGLALLRRHRK